MRYRVSLRVVCLLILCSAAALQAQIQMNVEQLADFIRQELALHQQTDKKVAEYVRKVQLTEKLTDKTITDLQAQGAGQKTVEALQHLRDETANMKPPTHDATYSPATAPDTTLNAEPATATLTTKAAPIPPPNSVRQREIIEMMREYALNYTQNLPNFLCVEVTRQYIDPSAADHYRSIGTILARLSYNGGQENYKVYSVNGQMVDKSMEEVGGGGAISTGEFGSLMREIFEPRSEAEFGWDHWAILRGRRMAVFNYFIDSGHSSWYIKYGSRGDEQRIVTAYRGLVYADENTGEISRIKFEAVDIPRTFPVSETSETLDYDFTDISGQKYVVPLMAKLYMKAGRESTKNDIEFRNYRKFGTESGITYVMDGQATPPAPLPASKTEEQPASTAPNGSNTGTGQPAPANPAPSSSSGSNPWTLPTPPPPPPPR